MLSRRLNDAHHWRYALWSIFFVAFALRGLYFLQSFDNPQLYAFHLDEAYYVEAGKNIAAGDWLGGTSRYLMDPLYSYCLALVFKFFGDNLTWVRLLQIIVDSGSAVLIALLGAKLMSRPAGLIAGLVYALYKVAFFYSISLLKETLATGLLVAYALTLQRAYSSASIKDWFIPGLLAGLCLYARGFLVLLLPLTCLGILFGASTRKWLVTLVYLCGAMVIMLPIGARNYWVTGDFAVLAGNGGYVLYSANNPENPEGGYSPPSFIKVNHPVELDKYYREEAGKRLGYPVSMSQASGYWAQQAFQYWLSDVTLLPALVNTRLMQFWRNYEIPNSNSYPVATHFAPVLTWPLPDYATVLALGLVGLIFGSIKNRATLWVCVPMVAVVITCLLFYVCSRFRFPIVPFLCVGVGIFAVSIFESWPRFAIKASAAVIVIMSYVISIYNSPPYDWIDDNDRYLLALSYQRLAQPASALEVLNGAEDASRTSFKFQMLYGGLCYDQKQWQCSVQHLQNAVTMRPNDAAAWFNLGVAYQAAGDLSAAKESIEQAVNLDPRNIYVRFLSELEK